MFDNLRNAFVGAAAVLGAGLVSLPAAAAVVNISDGDLISPIVKGDLYVFEATSNVADGPGSFNFDFVADMADAPLPVMAVTLNLYSVLGGVLNDAYLTWSDTGGGALATVLLGDIIIPPNPNVLGVGGSLKTMFTDPDHLDQTLTLGWSSRSGEVQYSMNVAAVPLPAGGLLLIGALGGLALLRRRNAA